MVKRIAHITDAHLADHSALDRGVDPRKNLVHILDAVAADAIDEIVFTGDIGEKEEYAWFFDKMAAYKPDFKIVLGNHDDYTEAEKFFKVERTAALKELYYSSEDEFYKYIFLDSSSAAISFIQLEWLRRQILTLKKIIIFIHHPILAIETGIDTVYPLQNRDEVVTILQQAKHEVHIFCGHYHMPDKRNLGKINQYTTPAISFQVKKFCPVLEIMAGSFGYRIITLNEFAVSSRLVTYDYDYPPVVVRLY